ncbi:hypothetical protein SLEP1_g44251 [Rubroshorea leprosula]|uniref:Uncharacterized protein n=2 Tax=Rubroshorea leprosula TaxID=152421 RepID=A0AAV5LG27_9ROSI|nr:hypothetical protein SLEP1_g44251 [Rubroshorea leprosula]
MALMKKSCKAKVCGRKHQRSWKRKLQRKEKKVKRMKADVRKMKAYVKRLKDEERNAKEVLEHKKLELAKMREVNGVVAEGNASIQLCLDVIAMLLGPGSY